MNDSIAIQICAGEEWAAAKRILVIGRESIRTSPFGEFAHMEFAGRECVFFHSGPTKTRSAAACQYAIDHWAPEAIFVLGTCGAVDGDLKVGDIVLADMTFQHDCNDRMAEEQPYFELTEFDNTWLPDDSRITRRGIIATGDQDVCNETILDLQSRSVLVADWESASIAKVCELNGIRCAILRGVTDFGAETLADDYKTNAPAVMQKLIAIASDLISNIGNT